jgi:hypothetical protein
MKNKGLQELNAECSRLAAILVCGGVPYGWMLRGKDLRNYDSEYEAYWIKKIAPHFAEKYLNYKTLMERIDEIKEKERLKFKKKKLDKL